MSDDNLDWIKREMGTLGSSKDLKDQINDAEAEASSKFIGAIIGAISLASATILGKLLYNWIKHGGQVG